MKKRAEKSYQGLEDEKIIPITNSAIITDPYGSYTGVNIDDPHELPVQDVDDLQFNWGGEVPVLLF